jgi:hypothetical protein
MEAVKSSGTLMNFHRTTWLQIPEENTLLGILHGKNITVHNPKYFIFFTAASLLVL